MRCDRDASFRNLVTAFDDGGCISDTRDDTLKNRVC